MRTVCVLVHQIDYGIAHISVHESDVGACAYADRYLQSKRGYTAWQAQGAAEELILKQSYSLDNLDDLVLYTGLEVHGPDINKLD